MKAHSISRSIAAGLLLGISAMSSAVLAEELKIGEPSRDVLCPHPATLQLQATATPSVNAQDFPNPLPAGQGVAVLNQSAINHVFRYSYNWTVSDKLCCEITKATLTVKVRWNGPVGPSTASNDTIGIVANGVSVPGIGGYVWSGTGTNTGTTPFSGTTPPPPKTIVINLNAAGLADANTNHRLSFQVQDDTTVESATLQLSGCCVNHYK